MGFKTRKMRLFTYGLSIAAILSGVVWMAAFQILVLAVGDQGPRLSVGNGDTVSLRYTQSMYGVPVEEKLRVDNDRFVLFEVVSTGAALEYLGIEKHGRDNVKRTVRSFAIPRSSVGKHVLVIGGRLVPLKEVPGLEPRILVRLYQQPLLKYLLRIKHE